MFSKSYLAKSYSILVDSHFSLVTRFMTLKKNSNFKIELSSRNEKVRETVLAFSYGAHEEESFEEKIEVENLVTLFL